MKKILTFSYIFCLGLLVFDSFRAYDSSLKYFGLESSFACVIFLIVNIVFVLSGNNFIPEKIRKLNSKIFKATLILSAIFILFNYHLAQEHRNFVFNALAIQVDNFIYLPIFTGGLAYIYHFQKLKLYQKLIYFLPPIILFILAFIEIYDHNTFVLLTTEDNLFENIQFVFYSLSGILLLASSFLNFKKSKYTVSILFLIIAIFLLFIAFEEISWGERVLGFQAPENMLEGNRQGEFNIHNQGFFQEYIYIMYMIVGLWGAFGRKMARALPKNLSKLFLPITPPHLLVFYFFSAFLYYFLSHYMNRYLQMITLEKVGMGQWQEVAELFLSAGFLLFGIYSIQKILQTRSPQF